MAKDLMFKLRLDGADKRRLEALAEHYSTPAATVMRMLIKKDHDALGLGREQSPYNLRAAMRSSVAHVADILLRAPEVAKEKKISDWIAVVTDDGGSTQSFVDVLGGEQVGRESDWQVYVVDRSAWIDKVVLHFWDEDLAQPVREKVKGAVGVFILDDGALNFAVFNLSLDELRNDAWKRVRRVTVGGRAYEASLEQGTWSICDRKADRPLLGTIVNGRVDDWDLREEGTRELVEKIGKAAGILAESRQ